jgi:hypothetical protein
MEFIKGNNRNQSYFSTIEDQVAPDNLVGLMDSFIDKLDMTASLTTIQTHSIRKMKIM